jgi:menaquinone-9 beta-reductase
VEVAGHHSSAYDLIVVGAGPAGASAAITAVRSGAKVLLLERGQFPRPKVCGEFVSGEALGLLASLLDPHYQALLHEAVRIPRARVFLDGHVLPAPVDPPAAGIARIDLDAALWESAKAAGVDARQQVTVRNISGAGPFRVVTSSGDFQSRALINGSGRWSNLNALPANGKPGKKWLGLKAHFAEAAPEASVDLYFFEGGYCGVQPVSFRDDNTAGGRVNACAMVRADVATTLPEVFAYHPSLRERSRMWHELSDPVSTSPLIFSDPQPEQDGVLRIGDAAGFVDPFVGDGISLALRSGTLAAQNLTRYFAGVASHRQAAREYRRMYEDSLLPVFRTSSWIRQALRLPRQARRPFLSVLERSPVLTRRLVRSTR